MIFSVTSLYVCLLAMIFIFFSWQVSSLRRRGVAETDPQFVARSFGLSHFSQYVPFTLILMMLFESNYGSSAYIHWVGVVLCLARALHFYGVTYGALKSKSALSVEIGVVLNALIIGVLALLNLVFYIMQVIYEY